MDTTELVYKVYGENSQNKYYRAETILTSCGGSKNRVEYSTSNRYENSCNAKYKKKCMQSKVLVGKGNIYYSQ